MAKFNLNEANAALKKKRGYQEKASVTEEHREFAKKKARLEAEASHLKRELNALRATNTPEGRRKVQELSKKANLLQKEVDELKPIAAQLSGKK